MKVSDHGRARIIEREGLRLHPYRDSRGIPTIGVGCTAYPDGRSVTMADPPITRAEADRMFETLLVRFASGVEAVLTREPRQHEFDAMVSLAWNIGIGGFQRSTVVKRFNAGDIAGAADAFLMWDRPPELAGRRRSERAQFLGDGPAPSLRPPPPPASPAPAPADPAPPKPVPTPARGPWAALFDALLSIVRRSP